MAFCAQCGQPVEGQFCGECGARVQRPEQSTPISSLETSVGFTYPPPTPSNSTPSDPSPKQPSRGSRVPILVTVIAFVIAMGGGGALFFLNRNDDDPARAAATPSETVRTANSSPAASSPTSTTPTISSSSPTSPTSEKQAVAMLNTLADKGEREVPIDNKYLISLSLKWVGVVDDTQQPDPFTATDIWNHFQTIIDDPKFRGGVKIVRDGHFGNQLAAKGGGRGRAWIAVIDPNLPSAKAGIAWCKANFSERGGALNNVCYPRKASPPHD